MPRKKLTRDEIVAEVTRLLVLLAWEGSEEGIDLHDVDYATSHVSGILAGMLEHLVMDGVDRGLNPAYIIGYLGLRVRGMSVEQSYREDLSKLFNWDALDDIFLEKKDEEKPK